jgi:hypothetical protein
MVETQSIQPTPVMSLAEKAGNKLSALRTQVLTRLAGRGKILKTTALVATALLTTAGACDADPSVADINAGVGGANIGDCRVTITSDPANVRSTAEVLDANGMPSYWNVIGQAALGVSYPQTAINRDCQGANAAMAYATNDWYQISFNGQDGWVNQTVSSSTCP